MNYWPRQPISSCKEQEKQWPSRTKASELWEKDWEIRKTEPNWCDVRYRTRDLFCTRALRPERQYCYVYDFHACEFSVLVGRIFEDLRLDS